MQEENQPDIGQQENAAEVPQPEAALITIPDLAREADLPVSWLYERSRFNALPGQRRLGKYVRIDREEFFAALREGKVK